MRWPRDQIFYYTRSNFLMDDGGGFESTVRRYFGDQPMESFGEPNIASYSEVEAAYCVHLWGFDYFSDILTCVIRMPTTTVLMSGIDLSIPISTLNSPIVCFGEGYCMDSPIRGESYGGYQMTVDFVNDKWFIGFVDEVDYFEWKLSK